MKIARSLFLFGTGFLLILAGGEIFLRMAGISERSDVEFVYGFGKMLHPSQTMTRHSEGFAITQSNAHRHLGPDRGQIKSQPSYRIALLGDSFIEGYNKKEKNLFNKVTFRNFVKDFFKIYAG